MIDFNTEPYNDDFDENNKFYRILFRPSFAVQARELTQMQTILQNQIKRHGDHIFKQGAMVIPGQISIDTQISYVKIQPLYAGAVVETYLQNLEGLEVVGDSGIRAKVIKIESSSGSEFATLYVRYIDSGDDNVTKSFADNEIITPVDPGLASYTIQAVSLDATGVGSIATIERGVYYVNGHFVLVDNQTIVLDKYSNNPTYRIGLHVDEKLITPEDPGYEMLLDNAQNSYNFAAPGAHRYYIDLILTKLPLSSTADTDFIELLQVSNGQTLREVRATEYSILEKTLARRTFDESGNYTVSPFNIEIREHRSNDRGQWKPNTPYLIGDIVVNNDIVYVARTNGTSLSSTGFGPTHTSGLVFEDSGTSTGIQWEYNPNPYFNRGVFSAEGKLASVTVTSGGTGYITPPTVTISGGGGTGAVATAIISEGSVVSIIVDNPGSGYTSTPTVSIAGGSGAGASAVAYADFGIESKIAVGLEPGKAYVQGYEIEKISTEFVSIDKARDFVQTSQSYIQTPVGNFVYVTNINSLPPFDTFDTISIYDQLTSTRGASAGTLIGTARVRGIEWDSGTIGTNSAVYKLFLFDININSGKNFANNAKSFFYSRSSGDPQLSFSADVSAVLSNVSGSVTTYTTYPTKGASTTLSGIETSFQTELTVGDYIQVNGNLVRVTAIASQNSITVNTSITVDGAPIKLVRTKVEEPQNTSLVFPLPNYAIKSVTDDEGTNKTVYYAMQYLTGSTSPASAGSCTMTVNTTAGVFASEQENDNYILMYNDATAGGTVVKPTSISAGGSSSITFTLDGAYASKDFTIMATIKKTGIGRKSKTLVRTTKTFTTKETATTSILSLSKADIYNIVSVKMKGGAWGAELGGYTIDITDRYDFDDGQRENYYGVGNLTLKSSFAPPSASIQVEFDYFEHGSGDYFTVDSYPSNVQYGAIPYFSGVSLRDCIDFRPRFNDAGTGFGGSGSSYSAVLKRGQDLTADFSYYLARKDKIAIDFSGRFFAISGVSSLVPGEPLDPALGMILYKLTLEPYTFIANTTRVQVEPIDNKRYTMRDIGKLEKRIENLEYYTSLSLLETETKALTVQDSDGLDRFKRGFIVDNFSTQAVGDVGSPDFMCSIDMDSGLLRPFYSMKNVGLVEKNTNDTDRANSNYKLYGDVITLPLDKNNPHVVLVKQEYASRLENINPFAIFTFLGNINITPSSDDWFEVQRRPDIIRNVEGNYNSMRIMAEKSGVLGTVWNAWQNTWFGQSTTSSREYTTQNGVYGRGVWANAAAEARGATYLEASDFNARFGGGSGGAPARQVVVQTRATQVGQSRTGVKTSLVAKIDTQIVDDRVVSTSVIPYMRSRYLMVKVRGLKPNTRFYPYFDTMYVDYWSTPCSYITYTLPTATSVDFDDKTNVGGNSSEAYRRIDFTKESLYGDETGRTCLNVGDVIRGATSGLSAVVIGKDYNPDTGVRRLHVANIKTNNGETPVRGDYYTTTPPYTVALAGQSFTVGETIVGTVSGAVGTVVTAEGNKQHVQEPLISNFNGDLNFLFWIPDYAKAGYAHSKAAGTFNNYQFRSGTREFKLVDATTYDGAYTSSARTTYSATGTLQTKQATVNAVRNAELVQEQIRDNRVIVETSERVVSDTNWYDPLAQTFLVQSPGGAFLSKVDIFFASKDTKMPVTLEIREVVNGYPGKRILPFSKVSIKPEQVNISSNTVPLVNFDGSTVNTPSYDTATTFTFTNPVYVQDNQEYAIVLSSDSNNYKVWISQLGDRIPGSSRTISEQPYAGVFFKSQNASTWTADQTQDLKFVIYRAKFDTDVVGTVQFVNENVPSVYLQPDPIQTAAGSNKVRIWHDNHGLYVGSKVTLSEVDTSSITLPVTNATGTISATSGSPTITGVGTAFTTEIGSGTVGSGAVIRTAAGVYVGVVASVTNNTSLTLVSNAAVAVTAGTSFTITPSYNGIPATEILKTHTNITDVDLDSYCITTTTNAKSSGYTGGEFVKATQNYNYDVLQPTMQIQNFSETKADFFIKTTSGKSVDGSETPYTVDSGFEPALVNENNYFYTPRTVASLDNLNVKSLTINTQISSDNNALSPIIDTHRTSATLISNKINAPTETNINIAALDNVSLFTGATGAFSFANKTITSTVTAVKDLMKTISAGKYIVISSATTAANNGTYLVTSVVDNGTSVTVTVDRSANFTSESAATATSVVLKNLFVDDIAPYGSSTWNKYVSKAITLEDKAEFLRVRFSANVPIQSDVLVYYRTSANGSTLEFDKTNWNLITPDKPIAKVENGDPTFVDVDYSVQDMTPYDVVQIKLVLKSTNSSAIPLIKDLRIISCV